jgi:bifunctional DNA-binding transcriptional regulator/antitoxin component of YhaV-PrlF toxin-antitoxin module
VGVRKRCAAASSSLFGMWEGDSETRPRNRCYNTNRYSFLGENIMELVTLNQSGYLQIPEIIRQQLGLNNESKLSLEVQDGKLILNPIKEEPSLYYEGHVLLSDVELLTDANTIIEELKNERINQVISW